VAAAAHNRLLEYVLFCLLEARSDYIRTVSPIGTGRREQNDNHERILDSIRSGDAAAARQAMQDDMQTAAQVGEIIHSRPAAE
jgi:DNA-binding FadR family transcriptional regulator